MKTLVRTAILGAVLGWPAAASIYQINFTGSITGGTASDFNRATNRTEPVQDLTGLTVSGSMFFNLAKAPAPTVSVDGSGFTNTQIQSVGGPIFVSENVTINGLSPAPAGFLPLPAVFNLPPIPSLPSGSTLTQTQDGQTLIFSTKPVLGPQTVISNMNFQYAWVDPQMSGSDAVALDLLISSALDGPHFFTVPPAGEIPSSFGPVTAGRNGVFTFSLFTQNAGVADPALNFGVTADYSVTGSFAIDSANGFIVTPEPGYPAPAAAAFLILAAGVARRKRRTATRASE